MPRRKNYYSRNRAAFFKLKNAKALQTHSTYQPAAARSSSITAPAWILLMSFIEAVSGLGVNFRINDTDYSLLCNLAESSWYNIELEDMMNRCKDNLFNGQCTKNIVQVSSFLQSSDPIWLEKFCKHTVQLVRAVNQTALPETEDCIINNLITPVAKDASDICEDDALALSIILGVFGAIGLIAVTICIACGISSCMARRQYNPIADPPSSVPEAFRLDRKSINTKDLAGDLESSNTDVGLGL